MKKVLSFLIVALLVFSSLLFVSKPASVASAEGMNYTQFLNYQNKVLNEYRQLKNRQAGTDGEKNAANFIKAELDKICKENQNLIPVNSSSVEDGVQKFTFTSKMTGLNCFSQNLVYFYKANTDTDKKIIIGCNYDSLALYSDMYEVSFVESESINGSAGSVAMLLSFVKSISSLNLPYNVEIIFFGAGESDYAGSKYYSKGILPEVKEDILCMLNIDNIAVGKNLYFYVDEVNTKFSTYAANILKEIGSYLKEVDLVHLGKVMLDYENELGLEYQHIAMASDNIVFMSEGITTINFFAGDYDDGIVYGRSEYLGEDTITYTENDNLDYITQKYGSEYVSTNLYKVYDAIVSILKDENFEQTCLSSQNETKLFYAVLGEQKIIAYLSVVVLIILIAVAISLHYRLSIKSYNANIEPEFLSTVISISQHVDESCTDETVPKAVSQVIARDIRKDKMLNMKKKNKKD